MFSYLQSHKLISLVGCGLVLLTGLVIFEMLVILYNGKPVPTPHISPEPVSLGTGSVLNYLVLGDSTSVGQGTEYQDGIAMATARHLALNHQVRLVNVGVSGARTKDLTQQLSSATIPKPDIVLIAVGANDVTHLTGVGSVKNSLNRVVDQLLGQNCAVKIVITGAPQMGSVARFPQPLKALAGLRTKQINAVFDRVAAQKNLGFARIAEATGEAFKKDPSLFAQDKFHPNARGYATWTPILNQALDQALAHQPSHCDSDL